MRKLECKLIVKTCSKQGIQSLRNCYMCENLIIIDDSIIKDQPLPEIDEKVKPTHIIVGDTFKNKDDSQLQEKAMRFNGGKPQWSLVHFKSLEPMIRVLEFGALKYAPRNWQKPMDITQILESMQRHLAALFDGEEVDNESGISHMGHIMCNAMFYNYHKSTQDETK